jgi:serine/threonine-protein kinase
VAQVTVPECEGATLATVRSRLNDANLTEDGVEEEISDTVDEGDVIRCEPASGDEVDEESGVTIIVSSGAEEVAVPTLRGQTQADATQTLREAGLRLGEVTQEFDPDVPEGAVIRSDPAAGIDVERDSQVNLVISRGPSPSPTPSPTPEPTSTPPPTPTPTPVPTDTPTPTPTPAP